jgi:hypothetical protein
MKYRKLRIAWSVGWGVLCLMLIVLWVRSYSHCDILNTSVPNLPRCLLASVNGELRLEIKKHSGRELHFRFHRSSQGVSSDPDRKVPKNITGFRLPVSQLQPIPVVPHWFAALLAGVLAIASPGRLNVRFSLRTLLIAMTVMALCLGVAVMMLRGS